MIWAGSPGRLIIAGVGVLEVCLVVTASVRGAAASLVSAEFSIVSGGLACIAGAMLLTALVPAFRRYGRLTAAPGHATAASETAGGQARS